MATVQSKKLFKRNLAMFRDQAPALYDQLKDFRPDSTLTTADSGEIDVSVDDHLFFSGRHDSGTDELVEAYWRSPTRVALTPPNPDQGDADAGQFIAELLQRCEVAKIGLGDGIGPTDGYFLILLGIGLGAHIDRMVERSGCQTLLLVEPTIEMIYHSLFTYDWCALFRSFEAEGRTIQLISDPDVANTCMAIKWSLREANACGLDGAYLFKLYDTPTLREVLPRLGNELMGVSDELGCYLDERVMVRNAYANLSTGSTRIYRTPPNRQLELPVFLVGSGPSLDDALPAIKENQDRAVIVSVGTALQPLLNNGIVPDFQVESENFYPDLDAIHGFLTGAPETEKIHLVAAVTCPEEIVDSFGAATLYFRAGQTPSYLFKPPDGATLIGGAPAVGNAGLSFVQWAGFTTFYLFGMDMGARNPERHHAEGSLGLFVADFDIEIPGNFGGSAYTTTVFLPMLTAIQEAIQAFSNGREYVNCSDGCAIRGTVPLRSGEVTLEPPKTDKSEIVQRLIDDSNKYTRSQAKARMKKCDLAAGVLEITEQANKVIAGTSNFTDNGHLKRLYERFAKETSPELMPAQILIRGSIFNMLIAIRYFSNRLTNRDHEPLYRDAVQGAFANGMTRLAQRCASDLGDLAGGS